MDHVYGREYAMMYLMMELNNRNDYAGLQRLAEEIHEMEAAASEMRDDPATGSAQEKAGDRN